MKTALYAGLLAILLITVPPLAAAGQSGPARLQEETTDRTSPGATLPAPEVETAPGSYDRSFRLPVSTPDGVQSFTLHDYLTGVLLAELPSDFAPEAMKAQAVACRTYALRRYVHRRHDPAAVCTDSACCQAWTDPAGCPAQAVARAEQAVEATDGLAIYYDGALIDATFFSCSGGRTEAAVSVWGSDVPYLTAVDSPGEEDAAHYEDRVVLTPAEFAAALADRCPGLDPSADPAAWLGPVTYTDGGGVQTMVLAGTELTGSELRSLFGLNATSFTLAVEDGNLVFQTRGFGHRVGMSQYGADAMARRGSDYLEILQWYYRGVTVAPCRIGG